MKIPVGEIPEAEIDEFGNEIVKPNIAAEYVMDGVKIQELSNFDEYAAYTKQLERNRDQSMLDDGRIDQAGLRKKNGMLNGCDFSKARIVAVGGRNIDEID